MAYLVQNISPACRLNFQSEFIGFDDAEIATNLARQVIIDFGVTRHGTSIPHTG